MGIEETIGLGDAFDRWVDWQIQMAQWEVGKRIESNFEFEKRMRFFKETNILIINEPPIHPIRIPKS